jgi:hypothetical protein
VIVSGRGDTARDRPARGLRERRAAPDVPQAPIGVVPAQQQRARSGHGPDERADHGVLGRAHLLVKAQCSIPALFLHSC